MIVDYLHIPGITVSPSKTDPPLFVDPDAVLTLSITLQCLQTVARRRAQVVQRSRPMEIQELSTRDALDLMPARDRIFRKKPFGIAVPKALDHVNRIYSVPHIPSNRMALPRASYRRDWTMREARADGRVYGGGRALHRRDCGLTPRADGAAVRPELRRHCTAAMTPLSACESSDLSSAPPAISSITSPIDRSDLSKVARLSPRRRMTNRSPVE